jgi:hypothetical protein
MKTRISWCDKVLNGNGGSVDIVSQIMLNISQSADHGGPHQNAPKWRWGKELNNMQNAVTGSGRFVEPQSYLVVLAEWRRMQPGSTFMDRANNTPVCVVRKGDMPGCVLVRPLDAGHDQAYWATI